MTQARDFTHSAYQPPWIEKWGPLALAMGLLVALAVWLILAEPWQDRGRGATKLSPGAPIRLSTPPDLHIIQSKPTQRIAIHGSAVYVTWIDDRTTPPSVILAVSQDSGKSFTERVLESPEPDRQVSDPAILCDSQGSVYLLYTYRQRIEGTGTLGPGVPRMARSDDQGASFSHIVNVQSIYTRDLSDAIMGIDDFDYIHLAAFGNVDGVDQVVVTKSVNRATSFEADVQVSTAGKGSRRDLALSVTSGGKLAVLWSDLRDIPELPENGIIYGALSMDGKIFTPERKLVPPALTPGRQRFPSVVFEDTGRVGLIFLEGTDKARRDLRVIRYTYSGANAADFVDPTTLFEKELIDPQFVSLTPGLDKHWYLLARGTLTDYDQPTVVISRTRDGGQHFSDLGPVADRFSRAIQYPTAAVQENTVVVSYLDYADASAKTGTSEVYAVRIEDELVKP